MKPPDPRRRVPSAFPTRFTRSAGAPFRALRGLAVVLLALPTLAAIAADPSPRGLSGLWRAKRHFGPAVRGTLDIRQRADVWTAEIAGLDVSVHFDGTRMSIELTDGQGSFRGRRLGDRILGHWIQPRMISNGTEYASPVTLLQLDADHWRGSVTPLEDETTLFLMVRPGGAGKLTAFLRNPERNAGRFFDAGRIVLDGWGVKLLGRRSSSAPETVFAEGTYDNARGRLSLDLPSIGGTFDFVPATPSDELCFFPRGKAPARYAYRPPPDTGDGWSLAAVEDVGISRDKIVRFVQMLIDSPIDSVHASDIHGFLMARHGKLVVEEYFHGFDRDRPHDTRSASKSLTSVLTGAAILGGEPISLSTRAPTGLAVRPLPITSWRVGIMATSGGWSTIRGKTARCAPSSLPATGAKLSWASRTWTW